MTIRRLARGCDNTLLENGRPIVQTRASIYEALTRTDSCEDLGQCLALFDPAVDVVGDVRVDFEVRRASVHDSAETDHILTYAVNICEQRNRITLFHRRLQWSDS